ncbi:MAG: glycosyltransferase family 4 protein [Syntrophomonadaceae bacterium]|nr:glycosyltransferase family 4 protein [Syntrophomonadaceae bacterium]
MNLINIGTYPPKQCGIATFSTDFRNSQLLNGNTVQIISVSDEKHQYAYGDEVVFNIRQNFRQDYLSAAEFINSRPENIDLVIIQHEYGIYGGKDGEYIIDLVKPLNVPYVLITHTVLPRPSEKQKQILNVLGVGSAGIICMTARSAELLNNLYGAPAEVIEIIPHGVTEFTPRPADLLKAKYGFSGKNIISTFGLLGPGKGLETAIRAMKYVIKDHPDVCYLILGQTHPMLIKKEGEKYRSMLEALVSELKLDSHVQFVNKFLTDEQLGEYLYMTDIYLSPYPNKDQAVSGTLAFAIGCARAIVSTSYSYAAEMLAGGRGLLSEPQNPEQIARLINQILTDHHLKAQLQAETKILGQNWSWPNIGMKYSGVFHTLTDKTTEEGSIIKYAGL